MSLLRPSHTRFMRRSQYTLPELRMDTPRVTRRISLVAGPSRSGLPDRHPSV